MKIVKIIAAAVLVLSSLASFAQEDLLLEEIFYKGMLDMKSGNTRQAYSHFMHAADLGHGLSMYSIARIYQYGDLGKPDLKKAEYWHHRAAERGVVAARYQLARLLWDRGEVREAFSWMKKAATSQYAEAQHDLAWMYEEGIGTKASIDEAAKWYLAAANNDSMPAKFKLVSLYVNGRGVEKNEEVAFEWAKKAAAGNDPNGKYLLGYMYFSGTGTVQSSEMARIWLQEAVDEGQPKAQALLDKIDQ